MTERDMPDNLPEEIWVFKGAKKGTIIIDTIPDNNTAYRLKSTIDAERAADSKTIRELAAALRAVEQYIINHDLKVLEANTLGYSASIEGLSLETRILCQQALTDNAQRIVEAQEGGG